MIKLTLKPQRNALLKGWDNELYALLQLSHKGKVNTRSNSKPLNLSIVLDRSGSMSGQPLEEAKKAAIMMIENLRESDKISIITFDSIVQTVVPSTSLSDRRSIINSIEQISIEVQLIFMVVACRCRTGCFRKTDTVK